MEISGLARLGLFVSAANAPVPPRILPCNTLFEKNLLARRGQPTPQPKVVGSICIVPSAEPHQQAL